MYEIHIKLKKKTQRDLEIIACGLNSKKKTKKKTKPLQVAGNARKPSF